MKGTTSQGNPIPHACMCEVCGAEMPTPSTPSTTEADKGTLWVTTEECEWIVNHLLQRNPRLFEAGEISPIGLTQALITVWIAQRGEPKTAKVNSSIEIQPC